MSPAEAADAEVSPDEPATASSDSRKAMDDSTDDDPAGAFVLCMGAIASLLLVVWQSKCHCKCNLCYLFQCERRPPSEDEMMGLQDQVNQRKQKKADEEEAMLDIKPPRKEEDLLPPTADVEVAEVDDTDERRDT